MKTNLLFLLLFSGILFSFCSSSTQKTETKPTLTAHLVDSITTVAQKTLGGTLMKKMSESGPISALDFCSIHAIPITDSVSTLYNVSITRLAQKNRNPDNAFSSDMDAEVWAEFASGKSNGVVTKTDPKGNSIFYKPIRIGMESCLNCHGSQDQIKPKVAAKIAELYPDDKAKGFAMSDLRGMWKVE